MLLISLFAMTCLLFIARDACSQACITLFRPCTPRLGSVLDKLGANLNVARLQGTTCKELCLGAAHAEQWAPAAARLPHLFQVLHLLAASDALSGEVALLCARLQHMRNVVPPLVSAAMGRWPLVLPEFDVTEVRLMQARMQKAAISIRTAVQIEACVIRAWQLHRACTITIM